MELQDSRYQIMGMPIPVLQVLQFFDLQSCQGKLDLFNFKLIPTHFKILRIVFKRKRKGRGKRTTVKYQLVMMCIILTNALQGNDCG